MDEVNENKQEVTTEELAQLLNFATTFKKAYEENQIQFSDDDKEELNNIFNFSAFSPVSYGNFFSSSLAQGNSVPSPNSVKLALQNTINKENLLSWFSRYFYDNSMMYKTRLLNLSALNNWDLEVACINAEKDDYKLNSFQTDFDRVGDFLSRFDYRSEFAKAVNQILRNGAYYCIFRDDLEENKFVLQDFPKEYSKILRRDAYGLLYGISYGFFGSVANNKTFNSNIVDDNTFINNSYWNNIINNNALVNTLDAYPPIITQKYEEFMLNIREQKIKYPLLGYIDMSHEDGFWAFKFEQDDMAAVPFLAPTFSDLVLIPLVREMQMNQHVAAALKIIISQVPLLREKQSGNTSDMLAVKPDVIKQFMGMIGKGLRESVHFINLPSDKIDSVEFKEQMPQLYESFETDIAALLGDSNLFLLGKPSVFQSKILHEMDISVMNSLYPQFANFIEFNVNRLTRKYKFKFHFSGSSLQMDIKNKIDDFKSLATFGVSITANKMSNAIGKNIFEFTRELEMTDGMGIVDKLKLAPNAFTQSSGTSSSSDNPAGRPRSNDSDLSDQGSVTRENGSNLDRGGSI